MKTIVAIRVEGEIGCWEFPVRIAAEDFINACLDMDQNLEYSITVEDANEETKKSKSQNSEIIQRKNRSGIGGKGKSKKSRKK